MTENFYNVFKERVALTEDENEFLAPSDADYASFELNYTGLYSEKFYQNWKDTVVSLDKFAT